MLTQLLLAVNGYKFGAPEYAEVKERMAVLSQQAETGSNDCNDPHSQMPDATKYESAVNTHTLNPRDRAVWVNPKP